MKRDPDLLREMLLEAEKKPGDRIEAFYSGPDYPTAMGHLRLLIDAGYMTEVKSDRGTTFGWRITSAGHDFLDSVRDPEIWQQTKKGASDLGSWTLKMLGEIATGYIKMKAQSLGIPML